MILFENVAKKSMEIFKRYVKSMPAEYKNPLYFYLAGIRGSKSYIAFDKRVPTIHTDDVSYSKDEEFGSFSFSNVLNIQRTHGFLKCFDFTIPSINQRQSEYPFVDSCKKLVKMRNKLAHERATLSFEDADIVELLPDSKIENAAESMYGTVSADHMSDETKAIFSNLIIMQRIMQQLVELEEKSSHESMD